MSQAQQDFIKKYNTTVQNLVRGTGIFPQTIFSQAIVESQKNGIVPGTLLATKYNNLFGIKDSMGWTGDVVDLKTGEVYNGEATTVTAGFRVYDTPEDSFADYVKFLKNNSRYSAALKTANYKDQISAIAKAGYATNPGYSNLLTTVANSISDYITPVNIGIGVLLVGVLVYTFYSYYKTA